MSANRSPFLVLVFIGLSQFSSALMHSITGITLPVLGREFGASGVQLGLVESIYLGITAGLLLPIGRFADLTDKNTLFKAGLLTLSLFTFVIGLQTSIEGVIFFRFCQGVGAALLTAIGMAIVADIAPKNKLGQMLGLAIASTYIGLASGPFFSGIITTHLGWRWVYYLAAIPPLFAFFISLFGLKSKWKKPADKINLINSFILLVGIGLIITGAVMLKRGFIGVSVSGFGVFLIIIFVGFERRSTKPLIKIDEVIRNQTLSRALVTQFLIYCGTIGTTFLLSLYLQIIRGGTPAMAGHVLVVGPAVMAIFAPLAGRLCDKFSPRRISAVGGTLVVCSVALPACLSTTTGIELIVVALVFQGLGFAFFSAPNIALIMNSIGTSERGLASALSGLMRSFGMVISMFVVTAFLSMNVGDNTIEDKPQDFLFALRFSFVIFTLLGVVGVFQAIRVKSSNE